MPNLYVPQNWYWSVEGSPSRLYSSKVGDYVPADDADFIAWQNLGNKPTRIASEAELGEVLARYELRPNATGVLDSYQEHQASNVSVRVLAKILFWCVNEIRELKGQQPLSAAQFRAFIKSQL